MSNDRIEAGKAPHITVEGCDGDLVIRGWPESALRIRGNFEAKESDKGFRLVGQGSLTLAVPGGASVSVAQVGGDLAVKHVSGFCDFAEVSGDVVLSDMGEVSVGVVHGDLAAKSLQGELTASEAKSDVHVRNAANVTLGLVNGDVTCRRVDASLTIKEIAGDADLRHIDGDVSILQSHRDVNLVNVGGAVSVADVQGDVRLRGRLSEGDHSLQAQGDIVLRWPVGEPLNLVVTAGRIDNRLPLEDVVEKQGNLMGHIGQSQVNLTLSAGGRVVLREAELANEKWGSFGTSEAGYDFEVDLGDISSRVEAEVNTHIARVARELETKFGADFGQRFAENVSRKAGKAAERAERAAERVARRMDQRGRPVRFDAPVAPAPARKEATTEEQLKILKMVEAGKISPEEASMLLEALGG